MKKVIIRSLVLAIFTVSSFAFANKKDPIKIEKSQIHWIGKKVTGEHSGTLSFKSGDVELKEGKLTGGKFVVDMKTINVTDIEGGKKAKLESHLNSDHFFDVEKYPEASFLITSVDGSTVKGDLTIKGHKEKQSFTLTIEDRTIKGKVFVDRTKFGIRYGSSSFFDNLKDKAIDNEFELSLNIVF